MRIACPRPQLFMTLAASAALLAAVGCARTGNDALYQPMDVNYADPTDPFAPEARPMQQDAQEIGPQIADPEVLPRDRLDPDQETVPEDHGG